MKRTLAGLLVLFLALTLAATAETRTLVRMEGWIVDSHCGSKNAGKESVEDTLACVRKGAKLVFVNKDGTSYAIEDQERALEHAGRKVRVFGTVDGSRNLRVGNYVGSAGKRKKTHGDQQGLGLKPGRS